MALRAAHGSDYLFVVGTRPEAVKLAPIILALASHGQRATLVSTGQHRDLLDGALAAFGLVPDHDLAVMRAGQDPADVIGQLVPALTLLFGSLAPRAVIVQGDTATTLAGALAARYARLPLVHVEAGLRSDHDEPFPEEMHRKLVAQLAALHFAPTAAAAAALAAEGVAPAAVHVTGNSGIDALRWMQDRLGADAALTAALGARFAAIDRRRPLILATVHRRENHGLRLTQVLAALAELADAAEIVLPVHPHPAVAGPVAALLAGVRGVHLLPPLDYPAFVWLLRRATLALTDSGGVQEEAPALGVPVLIMRDVTERREGIDSGNARLVGTSRTAIVDAVRSLLADSTAIGRMSEPAWPYGAGDTARRIVAIMDATFAQPMPLAAE